VNLPPFGFETYYLARSSRSPIQGEAHSIREVQAIENEHVLLEYNSTTGALSSFTNKRTKVQTEMRDDFWEYRSFTGGQASGAYIFRPTGTATLADNNVETTFVTGPYVQEVRQSNIPNPFSALSPK